jgi:plastocyanin
VRAMLAAVAATVALTGLAAASQAEAGRGTSVVGVGEREWRIALYRSSVPAGRVRFNVRNFGEDGHDLAVRNRNGTLLGHLPELRPGATGRLTVRLRRPGRYTMFCALEGHEALGMRAVLRVRKRR